MTTERIDVLAVMVGLNSLGGRFVPEWNERPIGTGQIAQRARTFRNGYGRLSLAKTPTTPAVLRALRQAERDGLVECVGAGHCTSISANAADFKENRWRLTPAALARVGGA